MLEQGRAQKLVIYVSALAKYEGVPVHQRLLTFFHEHGSAGATVTMGAAGFGPQGSIHRTKVFSITDDVPVRVEVVESPQTISHLLPFVYDMVGDGLIEILETNVVKYARRPGPAPRMPPPHVRLRGPSKLLRIFIGEGDTWEGEPLYEAIVKRLKMMDLAGATVFKGILGYGASRRIHAGGLLRLSKDLPVEIAVIDSEEKIRKAIAVLDEMIPAGLVALSDVEVIEYRASTDWTEESEAAT